MVLHETTSLCRVCKVGLAATVESRGDEVWMAKACPEHGEQEVRLSNDVEWYERTRATEPICVPPTAPTPTPVDLGCPFDCGPCEAHSQKVRLPVVTITSACNLDCPICYVHNKNDDAFHMGVEEFGAILGHLVRDHGRELDIVNFTGGEPTLHPHFLEFLEMARAAGIHRSTICTNGIRFAKDESLVSRVAELGGRVALSFDSFDSVPDEQMQGMPMLATKMKCLDLLEKYDVDTTLIPVMTAGVNDHEIGDIIRLGLSRPNIRHLEIHTITFTGQGGIDFDRSTRISMFEVLQRIEETTQGQLTPDDFVSSPCAHPLCYQIAYLLMDPEGGAPVPFTRFMSRDTLYQCLSDRLYLEPTPQLETAIREAIDKLWVDDTPESGRMLRLLKGLLEEMFPGGRPLPPTEAMRVGEKSVKAVYVHSHMDEETFDTERVAQCCDSNCYADGKTIPVCSYNVLYRDKEAHFMLEPKAWNGRTGGDKSIPVLRVIQ